MPKRTGVFAARLNITSGVLSVRERPLNPAKPNVAWVPTSYGSMLGKKWRAALAPYPRGASEVPLAATTATMAWAV
jgi:hypothetical protein